MRGIHRLPVTRSFGVWFDLHLNKRLSKQSRGRWFETPWRSLLRHYNGLGRNELNCSPDLRGPRLVVECIVPLLNYYTPETNFGFTRCKFSQDSERKKDTHKQHFCIKVFAIPTSGCVEAHFCAVVKLEKDNSKLWENLTACSLSYRVEYLSRNPNAVLILYVFSCLRLTFESAFILWYYFIGTVPQSSQATLMKIGIKTLNIHYDTIQIQIQIQKYFIRHKYKGTYIDKWRVWNPARVYLTQCT